MAYDTNTLQDVFKPGQILKVGKDFRKLLSWYHSISAYPTKQYVN